MIPRATSTQDDVVAFGTDAIQIYSVLSYLVASPSVLTFDGKPFSDDIARNSYPLLDCDLGSYAPLNVECGLTAWFRSDDTSNHLTREQAGQMKRLNFQRVPRT